MDMTIHQQVALDEALVPHASRLRIRKINFRLRSDITSKESTLQLVYDVLRLTPFYKPFLVTADVPEIYMKEFWATSTVHHHSIRFKMDNMKRIVNLEYLGRCCIYVQDSLTSYQVEHKDVRRSNEMYYPRFTKVIIHYFMTKDPSIPRRNKVNWHYVRDNQMFTTIKLVSRHQNTQQFGAMLPIELTNKDIRNSEAYKEYYPVATGVAPPKTKASVRKTKSSFNTTATPLTAAAGTRLSTSAKGKQLAKASKAKSLTMLSEVAMTEVEYLKLATKRSLQQTYISQVSCSGIDEGTSIIPGVPDVPTEESDEKISRKSSDEEDDDDVDEGSDDQEDDDDDQDDDDQDEEEETKDKESFDPIGQTPKNSDDEGNDDASLGLNVGSDEGQDAEDDADELYRDININLEGRDVQMIDVHTTQEFEDTHVTLTPVNPDGQRQSSSVSSQFVTSIHNPSPNAGIDSLFETTHWVDIQASTTVASLTLTAPALPPPTITTSSQEDFVYQVEHKDGKKSNEMYYPRFTKVIIHYFMTKDPSIPRRNKKEYYAVASGAAPPNTKASVRKTKSSYKTTITPPTAAGIRLSTSANEKQPAKASKAKGLTVLSEVEHKDTKKSSEMFYPRFTKVIFHYFMSKDPSIPKRNKVNWHYVKDDQMFTTIKLVAMTEAEQLKLATKRSLQQTPISQASGSGADEGTGTIPGVPDVDDQDSDEEGKEFIHPRLTIHDEKETRDEESFDPILKTAKNTDDEGNGEENLGLNIGREEGQDEEDDEDELYKDVNINLEGRVSSSASSQFVTSMLNLTPDAGIESILRQPPRPRDEAQAENEEFLKTIDENMQKIIKEQVKEQVKTSYAVAADLSEMELKKILIEKMEGNKSIHRSNKQRNLYKALVKAYESDKIILDTYKDTVTLKRRKEPESASAPKEKATKSADKSTQGSKSRQTSASESATAEEPIHTTHEMEEPSHLEFETSADDQPIAKPSQHPEWFSQQKKPPTPDRD
nr:hypothetical protein [Tanacetum cinerariifolium]